MWQHMFCVSVMRAVWRCELTPPHSTHHNNAVFINIFNILGIEWQQLNEEVNEEIPDDGLKGSKHVGLFIKSVLSDFSVT